MVSTFYFELIVSLDSFINEQTLLHLPSLQLFSKAFQLFADLGVLT